MKTPSPVKSVVNLFRSRRAKVAVDHKNGKQDADGLVESCAISVESEDALVEEVCGALEALEPSVDWEARVEAMVRLEGLTKGGACQYPWFLNEIYAYCAHLEAQLVDRRSVVARHACRLVSVMMEYGGRGMCAFATALQPTLIKLLGISIAVVAQEAAACLDTVYQYCHDGRLLPHLCRSICVDRNGKIRVGALQRFCVMVQSWEGGIIEEYRVDIEQTILSGLQDASAEGRGVAKDVFEEYYVRYPQAARGLIEGLDGSRDRKLKERLKDVVEEIDMGLQGDASSHIHATVTIVKGSEKSGVAPDAPHEPVRLTGAQRILTYNGTNAGKNEPIKGSAPKSAFKSGGARRIATVQKGVRPADRQFQPEVDFLSTLRSLQKPGKMWSDRVDLLKDLNALFSDGEQNQLFSADMIDVLSCTLVDAIGDAHFKVALAAIQTLNSAIHNEDAACFLQPHIEKIMPALFMRIGDTKESIRDAVNDTLEAIPVAFDPDFMVYGIVAASHVCKSPKAQCAIMQYFERHFNEKVANAGNSWRTMLAFCLRMGSNKNPDVRQCAISACAAVHNTGRAAAVEAALSGLPQSPRVAVSRALKSYVAQSADANVDHNVLLQAQQYEAECVNGGIEKDIRSMNDEEATLCHAELDTHEALRSMEEDMAEEVEEDMAEEVEEDMAEEVEEDMAEEVEEDMAEEVKEAHQETKAVNKAHDGVTDGIEMDVEELVEYVCEPITGSDNVKMLPEEKIINLASRLANETPTVEILRTLNSMNCGNLAQIDIEHRNALGEAIWDAMVSVLKDESSSGELKIAACSTYLSFADMVPIEKMEKSCDSMIVRLAELSTGYDYELSMLSINVGTQIAKTLDGADSYICLTSLLPDPTALPPYQGPEAKKTIAVLKFLSSSLEIISVGQLQAGLKLCMPSLCTCFESPHAEMRKLSMDCIVKVQKRVGRESTQLFVEKLTKTQQRLIQIQFDKR